MLAWLIWLIHIHPTSPAQSAVTQSNMFGLRWSTASRRTVLSLILYIYRVITPCNEVKPIVRDSIQDALQIGASVPCTTFLEQAVYTAIAHVQLISNLCEIPPGIHTFVGCITFPFPDDGPLTQYQLYCYLSASACVDLLHISEANQKWSPIRCFGHNCFPMPVEAPFILMWPFIV